MARCLDSGVISFRFYVIERGRACHRCALTPPLGNLQLTTYNLEPNLELLWRLLLGNAIDWNPPRRYDFVRTGLEYVPPKRQSDLIGRLLKHVVIPGGRLIIGTFNEAKTRGEDPSREPSTEQLLTSWGSRSRVVPIARISATRI